MKEKHEAEMNLERRMHENATNVAEMNRLNLEVNTSSSKITALNEEIQALNQSIVSAIMDNSQETSNLNTSIEEQLGIQNKLNEAIAALRRFYNGNENGSMARAIAFLEVEHKSAGEREDPTLGESTATTVAPAATTETTATTANPTTTTNETLPSITTNRTTAPGFKKELKAHSGGNAITAILEMLLEESESLVASMRASQTKSSDALGNNVADTRRSMEDKDNEIVVLSSTMTDAEAAKVTADTRKQELEAEITSIQSYQAVIQQKCGWILANFKESQEARQAQIDNLHTAAAAIKGAVQ